jgi:hypothetical protein
MPQMNFGQEVQAEIMKTVRRSQQAVVEAVKTWTDTVASITPPLPEVRMPFASRLPNPEELVGNAYDLAEKLLASQRKFAENVLHAAAPMLPGVGDSAPKNGGSAAKKDDGTAPKKDDGTAPKKSGGTAPKKDGGTAK